MTHSSLFCLQICASILKISIDTNAIKNKFALNQDEVNIFELTRIAQKSDFKAKIKDLSLQNLSKYPTPIIAQNKNNSYFVVLKFNPTNQTAIIYPDQSNLNQSSQTAEIKFDDLIQICLPQIIVLAPKTLSQSVKFGFGWFYARILEYKFIVSEILLASFIMQLFGLVTPLFTQVVLDKVLVHHSISTLNVIAVAFLAVIIFEMLLSLARNYIFAHTTTKIDAKLGSELFLHLMMLPMVYLKTAK